MQDSLKRFVRYVRINTQSDDTTGVTPSTECQKNLGRLLVEELLSLGLEDAHMDEWGNVYAHLEGTLGLKIGLNAHMDTALEVSGENVKPCLVREYKGGPIKLANGLEMNPKTFPSLLKHVGHDLIVTDGNTLLGGDDKAGIAIIMQALEFYHEHPEVEHHTICVAFTVDEEIGEGTKHFNYEEMGADFAYTIDGADIDRIECENFNAKSVTIKINGVSVHPGEGKGKLINAGKVASELVASLPGDETPFDSEYDQGFWHLTEMSGSPDNAVIHIIVRDFEIEGIERRIEYIQSAANLVKEKYPQIEVEVEVKHQYENMKQYVLRKPEVIEHAKSALRNNGIEPVMGLIRGGTDGATMSKFGLVTPNLGNASFNHHGRFEYLDVQDYEKMIDVVVDILRI
ncbi:MAG: peptidase T [Bacilli bacterium]|nr:peptidase T [Bacilli bacterium]